MEDNMMVRVSLRILVGPIYDLYLSLPANSIACFNDIKDSFLMRYFHPISCHTLLIEFTQIHLLKNEKIQDFNLILKQTLHRIFEDERPNQPVFGCFKNTMPSNVKYEIKASRISILEEAIMKAYEMEESMLESNANP